ncbi:hypothetical protein TWF718_002159 [Orbilia javanica]|uniref:Uncharacterized protein n=1 Tax=Orbilia javanica TaxID=47235 RepID=A0AAN8MFK4_9PEZI
MDCRRDPTTGEPIGSVLYDKPSEVPEWLILSLLPLGAIGFGNAAKAVTMVQRIMEEEGHGVCEAVISGVKLFGVTDPKTIEKIRIAGSPKPTATTTTTTTIATTTATTRAAARAATKATTVTAPTKATPAAARATVKPTRGASDKPTINASCSVAADSALPAYLLAPLARLRAGAKPRPHERWMLRYLEGGDDGKQKEREGEGEKEGTGGEEVLGSGQAEPLVTRAARRAYVPPHLRHKLPAWFLARASSCT